MESLACAVRPSEAGVQASRDVDWPGKHAVVGQATFGPRPNHAREIQVLQVAMHLIAS